MTDWLTGEHRRELDELEAAWEAWRDQKCKHAVEDMTRKADLIVRLETWEALPWWKRAWKFKPTEYGLRDSIQVVYHELKVARERYFELAPFYERIVKAGEENPPEFGLPM